MLDIAREANYIESNFQDILAVILVANKRERCRVWWKNNPDHPDIPQLRALLPVGYHVNNWPRI